jgi:2-succinyl-5-enolpyruvyl-6-hydroxy-3-cyclohexene-1-carboxylate synthase
MLFPYRNKREFFFSFSNLKEAKYMFRNCFLLSFIELSIITSNKINKEGIFDGCESLNKTIYDFCIIGYWFGTNYGSLATYYALHQAVKKMGYSILMIDNPLSKSSPLNDSKCNPKKIGKSLYNISNFKPLNKVYEFNNECKSFLLGSDQLWKPRISRPFNQFFFLDFVFSNKKKIAYATSFGDPYSGTEEEKKNIKDKFKKI